MNPPLRMGVLLMTFGSAVTSADVPSYLESVRAGRPADEAVIAEFRRRYDLIGASPLIDLTRAQGLALQRLLDVERGEGAYRVAVGMLHSEPTISSAVAELEGTGVDGIVGLILAPQYSDIIMGAYGRAFQAALASTRLAGAGVLVRAWHLTPKLIEALSGLVIEALARFPPERRESVPVIFTAHSLPESVIDRDRPYLVQILATVEAVARGAGFERSRWQFAYQSAGHTPEEWLKPDFKDLLPGLRAAGHREVLVVPTQFLADHLEILYDIDVAGKEEAVHEGLEFHRIQMPNTCPTFIAALAEVVVGASGRNVAAFPRYSASARP